MTISEAELERLKKKALKKLANAPEPTPQDIYEGRIALIRGHIPSLTLEEIKDILLRGGMGPPA